MSEITYRRARSVTKREAIIALLSTPGTAIQGGDWEPDEWYVLDSGLTWLGASRFYVRDESGRPRALALDELGEQWWILEPIPDAERLEAERAELAARLEALNAKIAAAKEAQA